MKLNVGFELCSVIEAIQNKNFSLVLKKSQHTNGKGLNTPRDDFAQRLEKLYFHTSKKDKKIIKKAFNTIKLYSFFVAK